MADPNPPPDADRLERLRRRVDEARAGASDAASPQSRSAASLAMRFGGEFGAAVLVGAGIGFGADHYLSTDPWGLIIGLTLGFAAGVVNVVRTAQAYANANPVDPAAPTIKDDDEE